MATIAECLAERLNEATLRTVKRQSGADFEQAVAFMALSVARAVETHSPSALTDPCWA